jgi:hypothetical protein
MMPGPQQDPPQPSEPMTGPPVQVSPEPQAALFPQRQTPRSQCSPFWQQPVPQQTPLVQLPQSGMQLIEPGGEARSGELARSGRLLARSERLPARSVGEDEPASLDLGRPVESPQAASARAATTTATTSAPRPATSGGLRRIAAKLL